MQESILVIGTGQMGPGIALSAALAGYDVVISGRGPERLETASRELAASARVMIDNDLLDDEQWQDARGRITGEVGYARAAPHSTYVVEAIVEDMRSKQTLFADLEKVVPDDTLLASTTSALSPTEMQRHLEHPRRMIVTHYNRPAHLMLMCEVVPGEQTSPGTVERARDLLRTCGVRPVLCKDVPGFVFNRLQFAVLREALALLRDGVASLEDIEDSLKLGYGSRLPAMGPFEHADLNGLDLLATVGATVCPHLDCSQDLSTGPLGRLIAEGRLGMKTGEGFYNWTRHDPEEFKRERDREIIRRVKIVRAQQRGS